MNAVNQPNRVLRRVGVILFSIAAILGVLLILVRAVPDLESTMYGFDRSGYPRLASLACPKLMTIQDTGQVSIKLHNTLDRNLSYFVEADFSSPVLILTNEQQVQLSPQEKRLIVWDVDKGNISPGNLILTHVFTSAATAQGMHESTCGTFVLNLPFQGGPILFYANLIFALLAGGVGLWLWFRYSQRIEQGVISQANWMRFIAITVFVGLVLAMLDVWFFALLVVLLIILASSVFLISARD